MTTKFQHSFAAVYRLLQRPPIARRVVAGLLVIHTLLLAYSAYVHSPTLNEPAHLVAGLSHWKFGRFDLYRVNPPLVRMVAALPVMAMGYKENWNEFYEGLGTRPEIGMGENLVAANGERSFFLFAIARWACIPFSWLGALVCYLWARDLYGQGAGVFACAIWCFEPNILAHASLMTPDAHATALGLAACYTFWRWLKMPTWTQAGITGVILGLAELTKTTLILFYPLWPLLWIIYRWPKRRSMLIRDWLREAGMLAMRMIIGIYVLNLGYGFEGSLQPLKSFSFVSDLFAGTSEESATLHNRFAGTWFGGVPAPFPKNYLLGIDIQQKDFEHYDQLSYLNGVWRDHGWWYYYIYACAIKVPLGLWALALFAVFHRALRARVLAHDDFNLDWPAAESQQPTAQWCDESILLCPAIVVFAVVSSKTGFNEHMRYVLPVFPFAFIAISQVVGVFQRGGSKYLTSGPPTGNKLETLAGGYASQVQSWRPRMPFLTTATVVACGSWLLASSLSIYPHSLSYFNESIGGPLNGHQHLLGSNVDWGQDVRYLQLWAFTNPHKRLFVACPSYYDPADVGLSANGVLPRNLNNLDFGEVSSTVGAVSANFVHGMSWPATYSGESVVYGRDSFEITKHLIPVARAGYSILLLELDPRSQPGADE